MNKLIINLFLFFLVPQISIIAASYFTEIENCKITSLGKEYIGNINRTETGKTCLKWSRKTLNQLHLPILTVSNVDHSLENNFCRNPSNFPNGPWCFVDKDTLEWEYCNIPNCNKGRNWCKDTNTGEEYIGLMNVDKFGKSCKAWNQFSYSASLFPEKNLNDAKSYCRNPDKNLKGPWCFSSEKEGCNVTMCDENFSQVEYFGGYNFRKTVVDVLNFVNLDAIYENITFTVSINSEFWSPGIVRKSSLWATEYDPDCQTDFDEYEYCQLMEFVKKENQVVLSYSCVQPLRNLLYISPLMTNKYTTNYKLGKLYGETETPSFALLNYRKKVTEFINSKNQKEIKIPIYQNYGAFYLLNDNAFPYAITLNNNAVFVISQVGLGQIGFLASDEYVSTVSQLSIEDFMFTVYGESVKNPKSLTEDLLNELETQRKLGKQIKTHLIWNAHNIVGENSIKILLNLVKHGLRIIIGIKPWAYHHYRNKLITSELKPVFISAGVWPSIDFLNDNVAILNTLNVKMFPLAILLDHAKLSITDLIAIADVTNDILLQTPFEDLIEEYQFKEIKENMQTLFNVYLKHAKSRIPCLSKPLIKKDDRILIGLINRLMIQSLGNKFLAPGVSFYPGITTDIKSKTIKMKVNAKFNTEVIQLGLYINPGEDVSVKFNGSKSNSCQLYVNYHLFDVSDKTEWIKWPITTKEFTLKHDKFKTFSFSFGGLLSLKCEENNDKVDILLNNVIEIPMFDRRDPDLNKRWNEFQKTNTPWVILASDTVVFVLSSNTIRNMADPESVLELYDSMVKEELHLRGKSVSENRREIVSTDLQIKAGYMHAGYPIGTPIVSITNPAWKTYYLFNKEDIKKSGRWGLLHEIGHNLQDSLFTFSGTGEVTNNLFTLVAIESMTGLSSWSVTEGRLGGESNLNMFMSQINNGNFTSWKSGSFVALAVYAQIRNSFGWELYRQLFRKYNVLNREIGKINEDDKIQLLIKEISLHAKMNLCPLFDLWKWPINEKTNKDLSHLPYFMPNDFLTAMVEEKVNETIAKYEVSSPVSRIPKTIPILIGPLQNKQIIEGDKEIISRFILNK